MTELPYIGQELELFAQARRWKAYLAEQLGPYLRGDVLEVGAGIGSNTLCLRPAAAAARRWVCLEPDPALLAQLRSRLPAPPPETLGGTLAEVREVFDTILYIDVLEHIEDDAAELERAAARLRPGGRIVVVSPAHPWLFSPFDAAIGHFRRYHRASLAAASPPRLSLERIFYLDAAGLLASSANKLLLRQSLPTLQQIHTWDRFLVPVSRALLDRALGYRVGKTIVGVWRQP